MMEYQPLHLTPEQRRTINTIGRRIQEDNNWRRSLKEEEEGERLEAHTFLEIPERERGNLTGWIVLAMAAVELIIIVILTVRWRTQ